MLAALYHSRLLRLIPIGLILLGMQKTVFIEVQPFGVVIQLLLALAVAIGTVGGADQGAIAGFVLGLMFDLSIGTPLGMSAIAMGTGAAAAGWVDTIRIETTWWLAAIFATGGAAIGEILVPTLRLFTGEEDAFVPETWVIVPVVAVACGLLCPILAPIGRWAMRVEKPEWKPEKIKPINDAPS